MRLTMRPRAQGRLILVSFVLMWLATIAREPGGLPAFASELEAAAADIGGATVRAQGALAIEQSKYAVGYADGVVCERDEQTHRVRLDECVVGPGEDDLDD